MNLDSAVEQRCPTPQRPCSNGACLPTETRPLVVCHSRASKQRAVVEEFVRSEFFTHFNATVRHFMPMLLALHDRTGAPRAVVGCRAASAERLFLETYTREPIERVLSGRIGTEVPRDAIVEIGSLACRSGRAAIEIVKAVTPVLLDAGFSWVVFTGADTVMNVFQYLKLEPLVLCTADQALLGAARHDWGTYYEHHPRVMAGLLSDGLDTLYGRASLV